MGGHYDIPASRLKAMEADATNPNLNVYHSIESLKDNNRIVVDHVYDEIKQKPMQIRDPGMYFLHSSFPMYNFISLNFWVSKVFSEIYILDYVEVG